MSDPAHKPGVISATERRVHAPTRARLNFAERFELARADSLKKNRALADADDLNPSSRTTK
jgi:hypothetical protein